MYKTSAEKHMKLSNRVILLVAPVVLISALVSSYIIYSIQKVALIKREDSYIQLQMEKLAGQFHQANTFVNTYAYTMYKSNAFQDYFFYQDKITKDDDPYKKGLWQRLGESASVLSYGYNGEANMAILDGKQNLIYYTDNKYFDPGSELDPKILNYIRQDHTLEKSSEHTGFIYNSSGQTILLKYQVFDKKTGKTAQHFDPENVFYIIVSASLDEFNAIKHVVEFETHSVITFSDRPIFLDLPLSQTIELMPNLYAILSPAEYLMWEKVDKVWLELAWCFGVASIITIGLIVLVLYHYILSPVSNLDNQLQEIESKKRKNIDKLLIDDEIGRLSSRFFNIYDELNQVYHKTKYLAETDHLTQLANRHKFNEQALRVLSAPPENLWLIYIDLDNFKCINDKFGHDAGDKLLKSFASHIKKLCKVYTQIHNSACFSARLSGDEFSILCSSTLTATAHLENFTQQLLEFRTHPSFASLSVTASVGIAQYPRDGKTIDKLISCADTAMYQAKRAGKNQYQFYSALLDIQAQRRAYIEHALRQKNVEKGFFLLFQPYLDAKTKEVRGLEVLLRWESDDIGVVSPKEFIPIAEQSGLFEKIDQWVFANALSEYHALKTIFDKDITLSINLSSAELNSLAMSEFIYAKTVQYSVPTKYIEIEITETYVTDNKGTCLLDELSKLGYQLAIDDFGSGYTTLTQLVQYPVQKIKFDREFLLTLMRTNNSHVIKPIIDLCHAQNKKVTAEGIEHPTMHQWISSYQCDFIQGYLFGKPMDKNQLAIWWRSKNRNAISTTYSEAQYSTR
ncbi:GGDEF domain-containing protein [Vibrio sagamiensis NBRC 104589]|uniref:GGDEF domain-containing protein n=2 Tax=Vibrio sagamiensis TaxID=512650 RepID=A0A511QF42_9VIBR|nr:GGDEF domain-containing protein [Vibrio sagamiensis NBRC 104589]